MSKVAISGLIRCPVSGCAEATEPVAPDSAISHKGSPLPTDCWGSVVHLHTGKGQIGITQIAA
jgi:hypothetical protein